MRMPPSPRIPGNPDLEVWIRQLRKRLEQSVKADILWRSGDSPDPRWEFTSTIIAGYSDATTVQVELDCTDGKVKAGAGAVILDANGVGILGVASWANANSISFTNSSGGVLSFISNISATTGAMWILNGHNGSAALSSASDMVVQNYAATGYQSRQYLGAHSGGDSAILLFQTDDGVYEPSAVLQINGSARLTIQNGQHPTIVDGSGNTLTLARMAYSGGVSGSTIDTTWGSAEADVLTDLRAGYNALRNALVTNGLMAAS